MTNEQLQKLLPRFPAEAEIQLIHNGTAFPVDHVEFSIPTGAITVEEATAPWGDMVRAQLKLRLVAASLNPQRTDTEHQRAAADHPLTRS